MWRDVVLLTETLSTHIYVCVCVCVRACVRASACECVRVTIIVQNFVLFTTSAISLQYEFTLKYLKLRNNNNNNNNTFQIT